MGRFLTITRAPAGPAEVDPVVAALVVAALVVAAQVQVPAQVPVLERAPAPAWAPVLARGRAPAQALVLVRRLLATIVKPSSPVRHSRRVPVRVPARVPAPVPEGPERGPADLAVGPAEVAAPARVAGPALARADPAGLVYLESVDRPALADRVDFPAPWPRW